MFTSRLPQSTSVRRPTQFDNGSTSFVRSSSGIPVTVKKANLFTPQNKRPFQVGTSTSKKSYISGFATERKFQTTSKPAPDRDQQTRMFENLVDYLKSQAPQFPIPEARRFFSSVSTTESSRIFEFLIGRFIPNFKVTKLEKDVPEALTLLEYPFIRSVTKSALVSVTTRQAATGLLVIFDWLVTRLIEMETFGYDSTDAEENEVAMLVDCEGEVDLDEYFARKYPPIDDMQAKEAAIQELYDESDRVSQKLETLEDLLLEIGTYEENTNKLSSYIADMNEHIKNVKEEEKNCNKQAALVEEELRTLKLERTNDLNELQMVELGFENVTQGEINEETSSLRATLDQIERNYEDIRAQFKEYRVRRKLEIESEEKYLAESHKNYRGVEEALENKLDSLRIKLESARTEADFFVEKEMKKFDSEFELIRQRYETLVKEARREREKAEELESISEHNNKVLRSALHLLQQPVVAKRSRSVK